MKRSFLNWTKPCVAAVLLAMLCISGCKMTNDDPDDYIDEKQTLKIESGALVSCNQEAEYVEIPNGVTKIGDSAFSSCQKLKGVTIPASVTHISGSAFNGCGGLTINYGGTKEQWAALKVSLPQGSYILCSDGTFESGGNPDDVQFPVSNPGDVQNPGSNTEDPYNPDLNPEQKTCTLYFYPNAPEGTPESETLEPKTVTVNVGSMYKLPGEPVFNVEGYYFLGWTESLDYASYTYKQGEEVWIPTELNIPDTYALYAVWGDITADTTYINGLCIYQNTVVGYVRDELPADLVIPDGVTAIGYRVFSPLSGRDPCEIKSVTIPGSVQRIVEDAFSNCPNLEKVVIKEGQLSEIEHDAFFWCESLKSVELPDNVKSIGKYAFSGCTNLESVTMNGVKTIEASAFSSCTNLASVAMNSVEKIEEWAFMNSCLTNVHLPNTLEFIGERAFARCDFESLTIPDNIDVENIGKYAFWYCKKLKQVVLPDNWNEINSYMFAYCESLTDVKFPSALKIIGECAFAECGFTEVVIPDGVQEIGRAAFSDCKNLSKVEISDSVTSVGKYAFTLSTNPITILLPASILNDGVEFWDIFDEPNSEFPIIDDRYSDCRNIEIIFCDGVTRIPKDFFFDHNRRYHYLYKSIKIPNGVKTIGEGAFYSAFCENSIELPDSVTVIEDNALRACHFAGKLPRKLEYIGDSAFANYYGESVIIPGSVKFFDEFAFYYSNLKSVIIEPGVTEIPGGTFAAARGDVPGVLEKIEIPNTVTKIGPSAFFYQPNLTDIKIPDSVKCISWDAFVGCKNLNAHVTGEWYRVNKDDETKIVANADPNGNNLYLYSSWNWYRK